MNDIEIGISNYNLDFLMPKKVMREDTSKD